MQFPNTVDELISALDSLYPEFIAHPGDDPQVITHSAMQRSVVLHLKTWRQRPLETPPVPRRRGAGRYVSREDPQS